MENGVVSGYSCLSSTCPPVPTVFSSTRVAQRATKGARRGATRHPTTHARIIERVKLRLKGGLERVRARKSQNQSHRLSILTRYHSQLSYFLIFSSLKLLLIEREKKKHIYIYIQ